MTLEEIVFALRGITAELDTALGCEGEKREGIADIALSELQQLAADTRDVNLHPVHDLARTLSAALESAAMAGLQASVALAQLERLLETPFVPCDGDQP